MLRYCRLIETSIFAVGYSIRLAVAAWRNTLAHSVSRAVSKSRSRIRNLASATPPSIS
jgi:hypothetical protein